MKVLTKKRLLILISIFFVIPLGLYSKYYQGVGSVWVNDYGAAMLSTEILYCGEQLPEKDGSMKAIVFSRDG